MEVGQEPMLGLLHASRRLLRPSCQVVHAIVATRSMVHDAVAFLKWVLVALGYEGDDASQAKPSKGPQIKKRTKTLPTLSGIWKVTRRGSAD
jgi:hypothetical protein